MLIKFALRAGAFGVGAYAAYQVAKRFGVVDRAKVLATEFVGQAVEVANDALTKLDGLLSPPQESEEASERRYDPDRDGIHPGEDAWAAATRRS